MKYERLEAPATEDDYRTLIENGCYYVDKTLLIKEIMDRRGTRITLITRPRRFGKTLNMTMIRDFFDITKDSKEIFKGKEIMTTDYKDMINTIPVIFLSFKECNGKEKNILLDGIKYVIREEYDRYYNVFQNKDKIQKTTLRFLDEIYEALTRKKIDTNYEEIESYLPKSLSVLTQAIYEYFEIKPIVIIDEYDNPFIEAKANRYYEDVRTILSDIFGNTFKGNTYISKGILTGIQRIAQESIFSKFNNPDVCTVMNKKYHDKFGLTEKETKEYLTYFGYELTDEVKKYYDGYKFYDKDIYNPMSITSYISNDGELDSYWVNTSSNQLIKDIIPKAQKSFKSQFEHLIKTGTAKVRIDFVTTFQERPNVKSLWGLLVNAGYVTVNKEISKGKYEVRIPNEEVNQAFKEVVALYIDVEETTLADLFDAMLDVDMEEFESKYQDIILENTSFYDASQKENSYHMLILGMCVYLKDRFEISSNIESGIGRADIILEPKYETDMNIILEFKSEENVNLETSANKALKQIEDKKYYSGMKGDVLMIGIAHKGKECMVKHKILHL